PALSGSVEPGESIEGWVVFSAATDESNLLLIYDSVTLTGNWADRVIALEDGAAVPDAEQPAAEPNDAGSDPGAPAGFNSAIVTDDWAIEVLDVATGQAVYDLFPTSDYRTTALGDVDANSLGRWIAFRVQVTNNQTGGQPAYFSPTAFTVADGDGNPAPDVLTLSPPNPDAAGAYYPGGSRDGWVVFELPIDWSGTLVRFQPYQTDDDPRYFTWGDGAPQEEPERETGPIEEGATVQTTDEVNLRAEPTTDAEIVTTLDAGTELRVTGAGEQGGDYTWYPVENTETDETGYVAGDFLEPVEG
ncbi:MAG: SH3 domain-containing protein, partial [Thermomicrobiales bacterium]